MPLCKFYQLLLLFKVLGYMNIEHKYNHNRYVLSALHALSEAFMVQLLVDIRRSPFFTLLFDLSSDVSTEEHMLVYVRYLHANTFVHATTYLCCVRVMGKTGEQLAATVMQVCAALGLDYTNKLIGVCTDGESANTGVQNGCIAILKRSCKQLAVAVHCCAHKTNLVMVDAAKHLSILRGVDVVLSKVHGMFNRRTGKFRVWEKFCAKNHIRKVRFPGFNATRWFSRAEGVFTLVQNLPALVVFLHATVKHLEWTEAQALLNILLDVRTVIVLHALCDLLTLMEQLAQKF